MMSSTFGREMAQIHFEQLFAEAQHDSLVGCLKRERRNRSKSAAAKSNAIRRRHGEPCPMDIG